MEHQIIVTSIARVSDGLPLVAGSEPGNPNEETRACKTQMKKVLAAVGKGSAREPEVCVALGPMYVLYLVQDNVVFAGLFVKSYSQQFAASYLGELRKEFFQKYDKKTIANASVAFALMDFEKFIEKSKRAFEQTKTNRNLTQVQGALNDIHKVMHRSLSEVVNRGEDIGVLGSKSETVLAESESYRKASVELNRMKFWQKYGVILVIVGVIVLVFYLRSKFF